MNHVVVSKDGAKTKIGCDKVALKGVLHTLFDRKVSELREACKEEGGADLTFAERMDNSVSANGVGAYRNLWFLVALKPMQLADTVDEIDYVQRGWSKPFDELTREDYETFCREGNGHQGGLECDPERDLDTVAWNSANMGHLPMLRYCVEKMGADPNYSNHYHMSMLLMTGRFGHDACLRYLCSKLTKEQIDHTSGGLGLSAIGDAAKCGHARCIRTLLSLGAAVDPRRKNGKTPLHEVYIRVEINGAGSSNSRDSRAGLRERPRRVRPVSRGRRRRRQRRRQQRQSARRPRDGVGHEPGGRAGGAARRRRDAAGRSRDAARRGRVRRVRRRRVRRVRRYVTSLTLYSYPRRRRRVPACWLERHPAGRVTFPNGSGSAATGLRSVFSFPR